MRSCIKIKGDKMDKLKELLRVDDETKPYVQEIAEFYYRKNNMNLDNTLTEIKDLNIIYLKYNKEDDKIDMGLSRIGLLIGKRGKNIEDLNAIVSKPIRIYEIEPAGNSLTYYLECKYTTDYEYTQNLTDYGY